MRVLVASPRGFCAGVKRAIEIVDRALKVRKPPVYVRKEIVHNRFVVEDLRQRGAVFVEELSGVPQDASVVFSAHGVAPKVREEAAARGLNVIDATCPLVTKVHDEVVRFAAAGYELVLIGHNGHDEVTGTMGEAPGRIQLVTCEAEAARIELRDPERLLVLTQTTLSADDCAGILQVLRRRFPALRLPPSEDICYATRSRQQAVKEMAKLAPVIIIVGAQNSSNSIRLREVGQDVGSRSYLVNHVGEVDWRWLDGVEAVGVTAGASAPELVVQELVNVMLARYGGTVEEVRTGGETVHFRLPAELESAARKERR